MPKGSLGNPGQLIIKCSLPELQNRLVRGLKTAPRCANSIKTKYLGWILECFDTNWTSIYCPYASSRTSGLTWEEIAELLDEYTQVSVRRRPIPTVSADALKKYGKIDICLD
jgi:hypothetical protein